jgi:hypothetical protein
VIQFPQKISIKAVKRTSRYSFDFQRAVGRCKTVAKDIELPFEFLAERYSR